MRNDFGTRPYKSRFNGKRAKKSIGGKSQGYDDRLDESLGARHGKKSQSFKARRDESKGAEKAAGNRAYSAVSTMDK
jgi:hypothetical protein